MQQNEATIARGPGRCRRPTAVSRPCRERDQTGMRPGDGEGAVVSEHRQLEHRHEGWLAGLARACSRHRWRTIGIWIVLVVAHHRRQRHRSAARSLTSSRSPTRTPSGPPTCSSSGSPSARATRRSSCSRCPRAVWTPATPARPWTRRWRRRRACRACRRSATRSPAPAAGSSARTAGSPSPTSSSPRPSFDVPDRGRGRPARRTRCAAVEGSGVELQFTGPVIQNSEPPATGTSELLGLLAADHHPDRDAGQRGRRGAAHRARAAVGRASACRC